MRDCKLHLLVITFLVTLSAAILYNISERVDSVTIEFEQISDVLSGQDYPLAVVIHNRNDTPIRLVGIPES